MRTDSKHYSEDTAHCIFRFVFVQPFLMTSVHPVVNIKAYTGARCLPHPKLLPPCSPPLPPCPYFYHIFNLCLIPSLCLTPSLCLPVPYLCFTLASASTPHPTYDSNHLVSGSGPRCPWSQTEEPYTGTAQGTLRSTCTTDMCVCKQTGPHVI